MKILNLKRRRTPIVALLFISLSLQLSGVTLQDREVWVAWKSKTYKQVVKYANEYEGYSDARTLTYVADCLYNDAIDIEATANSNYQATINSLNNIVMLGGFADYTLPNSIFQQEITNATSQKLLAIHYYTQASMGGSDLALKRLQFLGRTSSSSVSNYGSAPINSISNSNGTNRPSQQVLYKRKCTHCNGTGVSPTTKSVATYGNTDQHWCDVCHSMVSASHGYHPKCPVCNGRGYVESYNR